MKSNPQQNKKSLAYPSFRRAPKKKKLLPLGIPPRGWWRYCSFSLVIVLSCSALTVVFRSTSSSLSTVLSTDENDATSKAPPLRVALLGAGLFATNSHAPILMKHREVFDTRAVWSRGKESATTLARKLNCEALSGSKDLDTLVVRSDIDAFVVALPLDVQPDVVVRLLRAGKHVLSEKPIAPDVETAKRVLREHQTLQKQRTADARPPLVWSVAENLLYEPGIQKAAELVRSSSIIGTIVLVTLVVQNPFRPDNPYLNTAWRKDPSWYGGFFVDTFIHAAAGLRAIVPGDVRQVSAVTSHRAPEHLPGPDTMAAHVAWESGAVGTISASFAGDAFRYAFEITGRNGTVLLQRSTTQPGYDLVVATTTKGGTGNKAAAQREETFFGFHGLEEEFLAFAKACRSSGENKDADDINTPLEALKDLEFVEALLESGKQGGVLLSL